MQIFNICPQKYLISCDRDSGRRPQNKKRPRSEVALYYTTRPKRLSPHFCNHAQPPWKVRMPRAFQYEKILTTGFRCCLRRVDIQFDSKIMKYWNLLFWAENLVIFLLLLVLNILLEAANLPYRFLTTYASISVFRFSKKKNFLLYVDLN